MFLNILSFEGRIRRLEYWISLFIFGIFYFTIKAAVISCGSWDAKLLYIPFYWFVFSQNTKRCHDLGKSGWYQFIPFYQIVLLFEGSKHGLNEYGLNPKWIGNDDE